MSKKGYETGSRNVFRDLGVPNAEEHLVKAQLVFKIDALLKERGLKQVEAADLFGVRQPDGSKMLRGEFRQFAVERLLRFLVALDQGVEIIVKPHRDKTTLRPCKSCKTLKGYLRNFNSCLVHRLASNHRAQHAGLQNSGGATLVRSRSSTTKSASMPGASVPFSFSAN